MNMYAVLYVLDNCNIVRCTRIFGTDADDVRMKVHYEAPTLGYIISIEEVPYIYY